MKLSSKTHYGLKACHVLAIEYGKEPISATELGKRTSVSPKYMEQILRKLQTIGVVSSTRGVTGGYFLAREPKYVNVGEIVRAFEDDMQIIECVSKDGVCKCCPTSAVWKKLYIEINKLLDGMSLQDIADGDI